MKRIETLFALCIAAACQPISTDDVDRTAPLTEESADSLYQGVLPAGSPTDVRLNIIGRQSGLCLDIAGVSGADGARLQQWGCGGGANQNFIARHVGDGFHELVAAHSGKCLDVSNESYDNGAPIHQWSCWGGANQRFKLHHLGNGDYEIVNQRSGKCLNVANFSTSNGGELIQYDCNGDVNERFRVTRTNTPRARALLVLMENGGFVAGLPADPGTLIPEFTCQNITLSDVSTAAQAVARVRQVMMNPPIACLSGANWTQTRTTLSRFAERFVDFSSETIGRAFVENTVGASYDFSDVIEDAAFNPAFVRDYLETLAASYTVDIHVLAHGNRDGFVGGGGGAFSPAVIRAFRDVPGLDLRAVYQQNCHGSALNSAWIDAGADVVSGTWGVNYMPSDYAGFLASWVNGFSFQQAVQGAYAAESPAYAAVYTRIDLDDESREGDLDRSPAQVSFTGSLSPNEELQASAPVFQGTLGLRLR